MLNFLKSKLCCQSDQNDLTLLLELVHSKNYFTHEKSDSRSRFINNDYISTTLSTLDLQNYYFYVFLSFNCGFISKDQDFIYLSTDMNSPKPSQENLDPSKMLEINVNPYNISSGHVCFGLQNVDLTKVYKVHYMRKNMRTGQLHTLYTTKKFKIALKNRIYNLFLDSVNDLTSQELAIIYENDPFFSKISCQKMSSKTHRKNMSMIPLSTDGNSFSTSTKTGSANGKSRFDENILHRIPKGSIFTTGSSIGGDVNIIHHHSNPSYVHFNRDSFDSNNNQQTTALKNKRSNYSIGNGQDMARCLFNENYPSSGKDVGEFIATSQENEEANNETVIINENKENDEYIKKLCAVLNENLENAAVQDRESLVSPFVDYRSRMEPRVACPFKSIERVDSSLKSSSEFSMRARRLIDFSGQSFGKESGEKKRKIFNSGDKDSFCEKGSPEFLVSQQQQRFEVNLRTTADDECYIGFSVPNRKRGRDLFSGSWGSNSKLNRQQRDENLEKKLLKSLSGSKSDGRGSREFVPSGQSEASEESVVILHSIPEEEEREEKMSKNVPLENTENSQNQGEFLGSEEEEEEDGQIVCMTESPRESENGFGTHHTPGHSERLYTVEEVCSASKESSKILNSGSISTRNFRSSKKLTEKKFMRRSEHHVNEFGEWKNLDFENLSANVTQNSMREMTLEMMILKQKIEDLGGLKFEYLQKDCLIQIQDRLNKEVKFVFRWYKETEENDLSSYFDEIFQSVKAYVSHQRRRGL